MADLPLFSDRYLQTFNPAIKALELRRKERSEGNLTLLQTLDLIDKLLYQWQTTYRVHSQDPHLIFMPFLFIEPKQGDRILNKTTGETYTVDQVVKNPKTNDWEGVLRLDLNNAPDILNRELLEFYNSTNYVRFVHSFDTTFPNTTSANVDGEISYDDMLPTISWFLSRREPGSIGKDPFGPRKELKPRLRETVKDPLVSGYSVEIYGQWFDNIVQFDAWYVNNKTTEQLIEWFEQFMNLHIWILRKLGVNQCFFWRRMADEKSSEWRQPLWRRSVQYYFRTEHLEAVYERDLLKVDINLSTSTSFTPTEGKRYIADQLVSGQLSEDDYRKLFYDDKGQYLFGDLTIEY